MTPVSLFSLQAEWCSKIRGTGGAVIIGCETARSCLLFFLRFSWVHGTSSRESLYKGTFFGSALWRPDTSVSSMLTIIERKEQISKLNRLFHGYVFVLQPCSSILKKIYKNRSSFFKLDICGAWLCTDSLVLDFILGQLFFFFIVSHSTQTYMINSLGVVLLKYPSL